MLGLSNCHSDLYVSNKYIYESISVIPNLYDEPFADSSQIPTFLVSRLAKASVKVVLSGDGGDELFGGYNRYLFAEKYWPFLRSHPKLLKQGLSFAFKHAPDNFIGRILGSFNSDFKKEIFRSKIDKSKSLLNAKDIESLYLSFTVNLENIDFLNKDHIYSSRNNSSRVNDLEINSLDDSEYMMAEDSISYLPDSILTKLDRSAMSVSLESRIPFLDHEIFKFAWTLPKEYKIHKSETKVILKSLLKEYLPESMFDRPKSGFGIPLDEWLRGPLLNWADSYLNSNILSNGYLNVDNILGKWNEHKKRRKNWGNALWTVLMFQVWLESNQL
jgi:asparagine synthase (glutamine-hydrolysing)